MERELVRYLQSWCTPSTLLFVPSSLRSTLQSALQSQEEKNSSDASKDTIKQSNASIRKNIYINIIIIGTLLIFFAHLVYFGLWNMVFCDDQSYCGLQGFARMWALAIANLAIFCVVEVTYGILVFNGVMLLDIHSTNRIIIDRIKNTPSCSVDYTQPQK